MRKRFEQTLELGQVPISELTFDIKSKGALNDLLRALQAIYKDKKYSEKVFSIMEKHMNSNRKKAVGRPGMSLWTIFVLAQVRLCLDLSYDELCDYANQHISLRNLLGYKYTFYDQLTKVEYQNIYDNVSKLSDEMLKEINDVIVSFGNNKVFKKKEEEEVYRLKTDSFVVESNVHFPTDYNLLYDSARKSLDSIEKLLKTQNIIGWRKLKNWKSELKSMMRTLGKTSSSGGKNKEYRIEKVCERYLEKAKKLLLKIQNSQKELRLESNKEISINIALTMYLDFMEKHINLVERRVLKGEKIAHDEKIFSIFEHYTEWINKGKSRPNVELGKMLSITTNQNHQIIHYHIHTKEKDSEIVTIIAKEILEKIKVAQWSFDKGYYSKSNKILLQKSVAELIMPKKGKRNKEEEKEETNKRYRKLRKQHNAIESNINELEHRGLNRCPDRGETHFNSYIALGITAYNLKKQGKELRHQEIEKLKKELRKQKLQIIKAA